MGFHLTINFTTATLVYLLESAHFSGQFASF